MPWKASSVMEERLRFVARLLDGEAMTGERGGTRTLDPMIKSHVLYHLSYALTCPAV